MGLGHADRVVAVAGLLQPLHVRPDIGPRADVGPLLGFLVYRTGNRPLADESDPRTWIDLVRDDEFPLSMFYLQLKSKLEPAGAAA